MDFFLLNIFWMMPLIFLAAVWKAARLGDVRWFITLLVINTAGILEILYIYVFSEKKV